MLFQTFKSLKTRVKHLYIIKSVVSNIMMTVPMANIYIKTWWNRNKPRKMDILLQESWLIIFDLRINKRETWNCITIPQKYHYHYYKSCFANYKIGIIIVPFPVKKQIIPWSDGTVLNILQEQTYQLFFYADLCEGSWCLCWLKDTIILQFPL